MHYVLSLATRGEFSGEIFEGHTDDFELIVLRYDSSPATISIDSEHTSEASLGWVSSVDSAVCPCKPDLGDYVSTIAGTEQLERARHFEGYDFRCGGVA